jgi:hypothetical protein
MRFLLNAYNIPEMQNIPEIKLKRKLEEIW